MSLFPGKVSQEDFKKFLQTKFQIQEQQNQGDQRHSRRIKI